MAFEEKFVAMLRCPIAGTELTLADQATVDAANQKIAAGELRDRLDQLISEPIDAALITTDGKRIYPIRGGIPTLVADESIPM